MTSKVVEKYIRLGLLVALAALVVVGCMLFPTVPAENASDTSFVRQAVPILHGRKVRGYDEVKLLSDLVAASDRETVLRALMAQPRFVDHWSEVLVDDLRIDREGFQVQQACYAQPMRALPVGNAIAQTIVNSNPQTNAPGGAFNMADVVRSTIELDNLYPLYRANLYPPVELQDLARGDELQSRDMLGAKFSETYLNRQMGCLICHNSEFSLSGQASGWNRTYPIVGLFEKSLFSSSTGEPSKNAYAMFRSDARGGPLNPWGLQSCGTFQTSLPNDPQNVNPYFAQPQNQQFGIHDLQGILQSGYVALKLNGLQRSLPPGVQQTCNFCQANCQGAMLDLNAAANNAPNAAQVKSLLLNNCQSCHGGVAGLNIASGNDWADDLIGVTSTEKSMQKLVVAGSANTSYLIDKLTGAAGIVGSQMPVGAPALSNADIDLIRAWINGLPQLTACAACQTTDCGQIAQEVQGNEAFAYLVAARITNNVWQEVMGNPVTIANYFPRNFEQRQILWNLTEYKLLPTNWSLRDLLVRIMTSDLFNRVPPRSTTAATAYNLPPIYDPWIVADPRIPPVNQPGYDPNAHPQDQKNAMSDAVYRYSAQSLTNSVHEALDWPAPLRFPGATYPSEDLLRSIGFYFSEQQPGFQVVDFQGLLAWESVHGTCTKPTGVATDWIDRLVTAINTFNPNGPGGPLTAGDVATVMRDWLLGYGGIGAVAPIGLNGSEADAIAALFGVASLSAPITSVAGLEGKLRQLCGTELESPQFQLAGIVETGLGPKPRLRVCNTAECSYQEMCTALRPAVNSVLGRGKSLICGVDTVTILTLPTVPPFWVELCPPGICGPITKFIPEGCPILSQPVIGGPVAADSRSFGACPTRPPFCDSRCSKIDCCGGPLAPDGLQPRDVLVAWADGGEVTAAQGVQILVKDRLESLRPGYKVAFGDLIVLPPGSRFALKTREGRQLRTPEDGLPNGADRQAIALMISGDQALQTRRPDIAPAKIPYEKIKRILESPYAHYGEAGAPLGNERRMAYKYPAAELQLDDLRKRGLLPEQLRGQAKP